MYADDGGSKFRMPIAIELTSGDRLQGSLVLSRAQKLTDALNRPDAFIDFERDGRAMAIAKTAIASVSSLDLPKTDQLTKRAPAAGFDPARVLGVEAGATHEQIRAAYIAKARLYHPDQFANHPLPPEVSEYLSAMFVHVQTAYEELDARDKKTKPARVA
ncbi:chaperone protein DnaJ [Variibacter gotjawalensis]|uniref:Chaperone protein DnaJ n=1 Tax=Variibacter gotjawalensis TaxID=1333996 RepID=A0A0S3PR71_9BRAD|nr:DnaJ domain-containing protein [Variibacter gotjawalensis]NIK48685.1 DnaJ-domain-containing protein 1 [Variibacter gotjawalensis]RZS50546.1 DnaJ-like protein [Variibacter gotjawalensis]BAT58380.1 chaperone protein DnaJ [Variibacter gotjawalensis]